MTLSAPHLLQLARDTLDIEAAALQGLKARLDDHFVRAVEMMLGVKGRVVVTGMGKSGHIGRKIAATMASTGTPAMFVHPAEASHGDLGMIKSIDVVLLISNGGESDEITAILPVYLTLQLGLNPAQFGVVDGLLKARPGLQVTPNPAEAAPAVASAAASPFWGSAMIRRARP